MDRELFQEERKTQRKSPFWQQLVEKLVVTNEINALFRKTVAMHSQMFDWIGRNHLTRVIQFMCKHFPSERQTESIH